MDCRKVVTYRFIPIGKIDASVLMVRGSYSRNSRSGYTRNWGSRCGGQKAQWQIYHDHGVGPAFVLEKRLNALLFIEKVF